MFIIYVRENVRDDCKSYRDYIMDPTIFVVGIVVGIGVVLIVYSTTKVSREGYRDPIYLDPELYQKDIYPRANGSIYEKGFNIFSGHVYYSPVN